jgi:hypothetical protein
MDYKVFKNALTEKECKEFLELGKSEYSSLKPDQLYPNRGYPGFTLKNAKPVLDKLATFISQAEFDIDYDYGLGTGVNFINAQDGEKVGLHIDKPLYELDENYNVKPGFENRVCAVTVLGVISGNNVMYIEETGIPVYPGNVIVLKGFTPHEMKTVISDTFYLLSAFYCSDN